ncbi:XRE family transcriptional regulator [Desulfosarcina sp. OttesenSCG-928-G10]|nr:XRE family transcriptional regulator [Desulfosarcina sp. OttesenSCG-928-G10]MDL2320740.1 XRE family transcriptional regulator [Desulfosarcina sp. OttesenSCG-928-B08]
MTQLGDRIKEVRGSMSQSELGSRLNVSQRTIGYYERNERLPDADFIRLICSEFDVDPRWLLFGGDKKNTGSDKKQEDPASLDYEYIPMAETKLSAGHGSFVLSEDIERYYAFRKRWIKCNATSKNNLVLMQVTGDSMSPTLQNCDTVMIDSGRTSIKEGMIYALRVEDTVMVKRLVHRLNDTILVVSDNKGYEPYEVRRQNLHVLGQIIFFCRTFNVD